MTPRRLLGGSFVAIVVLLLVTARTTQAQAAGLITGCPRATAVAAVFPLARYEQLHPCR